MSYTSKIDQLLETATLLGFTEQDFAELAVAAADQSGASILEQERVAKALGIHPVTWNPSPEKKQPCLSG